MNVTEFETDFEEHAARVIECIVGMGVSPEPGCTLCVIRSDFEACPVHVGKAAAAALVQSWEHPVPPRRRWHWWSRRA